MNLNEQIQSKWAPVISHPDLPEIADSHRRQVTAMVLENTERALRESAGIGAEQTLMETPTMSTSGGMGSGQTGANTIQGFDPILISLVRRTLPNLMAYDVCGVQPMTGPTGLIFAMRSMYAPDGSNTAAFSEAMYDEADTNFSGADAPAAAANSEGAPGFPITTADAEALGTDGNANTTFGQMGFSIDKVTVTANSRALKAEYSLELAQDLKAVHGLDAESELSNILAAEILAEINREVIRTVNNSAVAGSQGTVTTNGTFDLDVDASGRWSVEKFKGLMFHIEREANKVAKDTRRGKANIIICSSDVASALQMAGVLDYTPALNSNALAIDDTGNTFAGVLNGRYRVYIDPYATTNYMNIGYKGAGAFDAGIFYCPYVPLQMVRAVDQNTFQPLIGFKTRYGMVANPFASSVTGTPAVDRTGALNSQTNAYYRKSTVSNLL
ncbi:ATP-binding protein [bacterium]|nr:ATP-binding protein [bacterium]